MARLAHEKEATKSLSISNLSNMETMMRPRGVLPKIVGEGVPHGLQNPDPISDQIYDFSDPFSDLSPKICTHD